MKIKLPAGFRLEIYPHPRPSDEFLERLIDFYHGQPKSELSKLWASVLLQFQKRLIDALEARNTALTGDTLCSMYATDLVWGLDNQNGMANQENPWPEALARLCMAIGVTGEEIGLETALEAIDLHFGMPVGRKGGGGMEGLISNGRFLPRKFIEALTTLASLRAVRISNPCRVLELGAGLGFFGSALKSLVGWAEYHTLDLPSVAVMQAYLLSQCLGESAIWLQGEEIRQQEVFIHGPEISAEWRFDLAMNQDSLPEMPDATQDSYLSLIKQRLYRGGSFVSINHEHAREGQRPVQVAMKKVTGMELKSRHPYWGRDGYAEEVWEKV